MPRNITQIAGQFIGQTSRKEETPRTDQQSIITITDHRDDIILDDITEKHYWQDEHFKSLKNKQETFNFTTFADKDYSEHLANRNRIVIPDEDGKLVEFVITNTRKYHGRTGLNIEVYTSATYVTLKKAKVISPFSTDTISAEAHALSALSDTEWEVGNIDFAGNRSISFDEHTNPYAYLKRIASTFELELHFRVETDGNRITRRYVDLVEHIGEWQGKEVTFGKDLESIERKEDASNIVTALVGVGPEREDGTRAEVFVEDQEALERWGRKHNGELQHIIAPYEPQSSDQDMTESRLRSLTENELEKRVNAFIEYEANIVDLEKVIGLEHEQIRFGDIIKIKDLKFNPPIYLEARVHSQRRSIKRTGRKEVTLGDYTEYTEEEVNASIAVLREQIKKKISASQMQAYAEPKIVESPTEPTDKNVKWIDTSQPENIIWKTYDENEMEWKEGPGGPQGPPGEDGYTPVKGVDYFDGEDGQDGQSSFLWIRYSQNADGSNMTTDPTNAKYIGIATTTEPSAPDSYTDYEWSLVKGEDGVKGETGDDGRTSYLHIKYSDDGGSTFTGNNGEDVGDWIGTYVDFTQADSNNPNDYTWNKVKGEKGDPGPQGIPGEPGEDGQPTYTWIRYADGPNGEGISNFPDGKEYIGLAHNKLTETESTNPDDYNWSLIKGEKGDTGDQGPKGDKGDPGEDGKDGIAHMGPNPPSNPAEDGTWFETDSEGKVIAIKKWTGSSWEATTIDAINLAVEKLSALSADLGDVTAGNLTGVTANLANGKFIVDENGNVKFAGDLEGASGTFGGSLSATLVRIGGDSPDFSGLQDAKSGIAIKMPERVSTDNYIWNGLIEIATANNEVYFRKLDDNYLPSSEKVTYVFEGDVIVNGKLKQGNWQPLSLDNGWQNAGGSYGDVEFKREPNDMVQLRGMVRDGTNHVIGTLPIGYRPKSIIRFIVPGGFDNHPISVQVNSAGTIQINSSYDIPDVVFLNPISFYVEQDIAVG